MSQIGRIGRSTSIDISFFDTHAFEPVVWCRNNSIFRLLYVSQQEAGSETRAILYESTSHAIYTSQSAWATNDSILKLLYDTKAEVGGKKSLCTT